MAASMIKILHLNRSLSSAISTTSLPKCTRFLHQKSFVLFSKKDQNFHQSPSKLHSSYRSYSSNDYSGKTVNFDERFRTKNHAFQIYSFRLMILAILSICYKFYRTNSKNNGVVHAEELQKSITNDENVPIEKEGLVKEREKIVPGLIVDHLPYYTMEEVSKHNDRQSGVWIVYKAGVYDVTPFIDYHPGGENILLGAGNSVEPFWNIYAQHHSPQVYELLESFRIGNIQEPDRLKSDSLAEQIFEFIPDRDPTLLVHHDKPFNAETPDEILVQQFHTPNEKFFIRNHLSVPKLDPDDYLLVIEGIGLDQTVELTLKQLKQLFPKHTLTSVIQCGGNRRNDLNTVKEVKGIPWKLGAIGNTKWSGARLIDVLRYCQARLDHPAIEHVQFEGLDLDATGSPYGASVPADKALDPMAEFLLAYEMNGQPLPADHGFPVRLIAPGIVGARNVKWLGRIILSDHESTSHWQRNDYKSFPPSKDHATPDEFAKAHAIQEMPIQSAICQPKNNDRVKIVWQPKDDFGQQPSIEALGYAWSGGGRSIIRVDLSIDGGKTWQEAELEQEMPRKGPTHTYSWTLWKAKIPLELDQLYQGNRIQIICRAFDSSYNTQPSTSEEIWNFRGLLNNSWHKVNVEIS